MQKEVTKKFHQRFVNSGHTIVNEDAAGHSYNACNIKFWKNLRLKYHMEDITFSTPIVIQEANFGKHQTKIM